MATFDLHQHLWPEQLIARLSERRRPPFLSGSTLTTTEGSFPVDLDENRLERRLAALDTAEIDVAVVSLQPTLGYEGLPPSERQPLVAAYDEGIAELVDASGGRIEAVSAGQFEPGFAGVCLAPRSSSTRTVWGTSSIRSRRAAGFLFVHPDNGSPSPAKPDWWAALTDYTASMQTAVLPGSIAAPAGGRPSRSSSRCSPAAAPSRWSGFALAASTPGRCPPYRRYFETSSYGRVALELCLATYGVDRLVHGSDFPVVDPTPTMNAIRAFGKATFHAICDRNPQSLLESSRSVHRGAAAGRP